MKNEVFPKSFVSFFKTTVSDGEAQRNCHFEEMKHAEEQSTFSQDLKKLKTI